MRAPSDARWWGVMFWIHGAHASPLMEHVRWLLAAKQEVAPHISLNRVTHSSSLPLCFSSNTQTGTHLIYLVLFFFFFFKRRISSSDSAAATHPPSLPGRAFLPSQIYWARSTTTDYQRLLQPGRGGKISSLELHSSTNLRYFTWEFASHATLY